MACSSAVAAAAAACYQVNDARSEARRPADQKQKEMDGPDEGSLTDREDHRPLQRPRRLTHLLLM